MQTSSVSTKTINSDSSETELNIFTNNMPDVSAIEKSVVKWLDTRAIWTKDKNKESVKKELKQKFKLYTKSTWYLY